MESTNKIDGKKSSDYETRREGGSTILTIVGVHIARLRNEKEVEGKRMTE